MEAVASSSSSSPDDIENLAPKGVFFTEKDQVFDVLNNFFVYNGFDSRKFPLFLRNKVEVETLVSDLDVGPNAVSVEQRTILKRTNFEKTQVYLNLLEQLEITQKNPKRYAIEKKPKDISDGFVTIPVEIILIYVWCKQISTRFAERNVDLFQSTDVRECEAIFGKPKTDFVINTWECFWAHMNARDHLLYDEFRAECSNLFIVHNSILLPLIEHTRHECENKIKKSEEDIGQETKS